MDKALQKRFQQIYHDNQDRVYRLCRAYLGASEEVDDLFQEIFLRVWQNLPGFRGEAAASTWVYRIGVNTALLWRKRRARKEEREQAGLEPDRFHGDGYPPPDPVHDPRLKHLLHSISQLKPLDRVVIGMTLEGFAYQEISEATGFTPNNVAVRVNRIKKRLKKELNPSN